MSVPQSLTEPLVLPVTDVLAWIVIGAFVAGFLADWRGYREAARRVTVAAWGLFALFWFLLIQHFAFVHRSIVETLLLLIAVPACLYVGWRLRRGRDSLLVLSRGIAFMGIIYLPFLTSAWARGALIEIVARQTYSVIDALGFDRIALVEGDAESGGTLLNTFANDAEGVRATRVVFACTGIESMAMFGGLIAAVQAPLRRKAVGAVVAVAVIWILNVARNVFIAVANAYQWFAVPWIEGPVMAAFGLSDPVRVSFFFADRVVSQSLAVVALIAIAWLVSRWVPEILDIAEELLYLLTGNEMTLRPPAGGDGSDGAEADAADAVSDD